MRGDVGGAPPNCIWLVHGTWASNAAWTDPSGPLSVGLRERFGEDIPIERFTWTGRNRSLDRRLAAEALRDAVLASPLRPGGHLAVAHSHGGNIVIEALQLDPGLFSAVVTLNTPFFALLPRQALTALAQLFLLLLGIRFSSIPYYLALYLGLSARGASALLFIVQVAVIPLFMWYVLRHDEAVADAVSSILDKRVGGFSKDASALAVPALCIVSADDEAFGWLEMADVLINLPYLLLSYLGFVLSLASIGVGHWIFQWNFARPLVENWAHYALHSKNSEWLTMLFGQTRLSATQLQSVSTALWSAGPWPLTIAFVSSSAVYYVEFYCVLAVTSLVAAYVVRGVFFGSGWGSAAVLEAYLTRHKVMLTPPAMRSAELRFAGRGKGGLFHSSLHSVKHTGHVVADWFLSAPRQRGRARRRADS